MSSKLNAYEELVSFLSNGETVEAVVFGAWGWSSSPRNGEKWKLGHGEPANVPVPLDKRGIVLQLEEACQYMHGWSFFGGYGSPSCYAVNVWTNKRVIWVTQYDGATSLSSAPRNPVACIPDMPGG